MSKKQPEGKKFMKKNILLVLILGAAIIVCNYFRFFKFKQDYSFSLNQTKIPYVLQEEKVYLFLEDILENGFVLDTVSGGYKENDTVYRYVLWTDSLLEDSYLGFIGIEKTGIDKVPTGTKGEIYINGLQIGCYLLGEKPMVSLEEFSDLPKGAIKNRKEADSQMTILFDEEGTQTVLDDKVIQTAQIVHLTLDGGLENKETFGFQNCSPYLVTNEEKKTSVSLQTLETGDTLKTKKGEFPLKKVFAGEIRGMRLIGLMEEYMNFSKVLDALKLSARLENGDLYISGRGEKRTIYVQEPALL